MSAKFGVAVFKASILNSLGGPLAKVGSSAKFGVAVFKASILNSLGVPLAKVGLSGKFGVVVFKASILNSPGGSIGQSRFVCQVLCSSIQGIYSQFTGGGPSAKVGSSAMFGVVVFKASILDSLGDPSAKEGSYAKYEHTSKFTLASQRFFHITYERPIRATKPRKFELCA